MKFTFSEQDSIKLHATLGEAFWLEHKKQTQIRWGKRIVMVTLCSVTAVLAYRYQSLWLPEVIAFSDYVLIRIKSLNE